MVILNKVCCCFQLTSAAVILGWLGAVGYFMAISGFCISFSRFEFSEIEEFRDIFRLVMTCSSILVSTVNLIGCVCLMVGSIKKIRHLMLPWLIGEIVFIIFLIFLFGSVLLEFIIRQRTYIIQKAVIIFFFLLFQIYVWISVYSLFQELRDQDIQKLGVETKKTTTLKDDPQPYSSFA